VVIDVGGTTTGIAGVEGGLPCINQSGASVGGLATQVEAIDIRTMGLGGDSLIRFARNGKLEIGPRRVLPIGMLPGADHVAETLRELPSTGLLGRAPLLPRTQAGGGRARFPHAGPSPGAERGLAAGGADAHGCLQLRGGDRGGRHRALTLGRGDGHYTAHVSDGRYDFEDLDRATELARSKAAELAAGIARATGAGEVELHEHMDEFTATNHRDQPLVLERTVRVRAVGRPRLG